MSILERSWAESGFPAENGTMENLQPLQEAAASGKSLPRT
jgi:hypothetical protein